MDKAEELLNTLDVNDENLYPVSTEEEAHIVIGKDRVIIVPPDLRRLGVQYDKNVESVTFDCPRYWDGIDLLNMAMYINYIRSDGKTGSYHVADGVVDPNDENMINFTWTISEHVAYVNGKITFLVCAKHTDSSGASTNRWNSEINRDCYISEGMDTNQVIEDVDADLITQVLLKIDELDEKCTTIPTLVSQLENDSKYLEADGSVSFGRKTGTTVGEKSIAFGYDVEASGQYSFAEGELTKATGRGSHAEGGGTIASGKYQHVQGRYNVEDADNKYAHILGGGSDANNRRNIHTIDWDGNAEYTGDVTVHYGDSTMPIGAMLKELIDNPYMHRNVFRGKNLGESITDEQLAAIRDGSFADLYVGDYWEKDGVRYQIADINYWKGVGYQESVQKPHILIVPDTILGSGQMHTSNSTSVLRYKTKLVNKKAVLVKESSRNYPDMPRNQFRRSSDVASFGKGYLHLHDETEEYIYMLCLDTRFRLIALFEISHGSVDTSVISPREVFQKALLANASNIIMLHNHPSGDSQPSSNDIAVTQRLEDTGVIVGIRVVDHVIIGHENCYSICEDRYISESNNTNTELEKENKNDGN